ncbi:MAG: hypothetical protein ABEJ86_02095 [Halococcoides sp.]
MDPNDRPHDDRTTRVTNCLDGEGGADTVRKDRRLRRDRRSFLKAVATAAAGTAIGTTAAGRTEAAPDVLPTAEHMHRGHQDVIFLAFHFQDNSPPADPIADYERALFDSDSRLGADDYTIQQYFDIVSDGRFSIDPGPAGLLGFYEVSQSVDDYHLGDAVREALDAAIADGFDITAYDQENPTQIVAMPYLGGGGGGVAWVGNEIERQGVQIVGFCKAPIRGSAAQQDINYPSHEYLHLHGLTDLYQAPGTGNMGIMGAGPLVNMVPWSKVNVDFAQTPAPTGWDETTAIHPTDQAGILPPQSVENQFYTVVGEPNPADDDPDFHKYYYLAYNDGTGVDTATDPGQEGLVVWHHHQSMGVEWGANNLQFATPPEGATFRASESTLDAGLVGTDVVLDSIGTEYGALTFNDPPERALPAGSTAAYAVAVESSQPDWLPDLSHREDQWHGDVIYTDHVLDARVAWADSTDSITLRLIDPTGAERVSDDTDTTFAVVRSDPLPDAPSGNWKLQEAATGEGTVEYVRTTTATTYELADSVTIESASSEESTLTLEISLAYADGSPYAPDGFGPLDPERVEISFDGEVIDATPTVESIDPATSRVVVDLGVIQAGSHEIAVAVLDRKAGVTHRTSADSIDHFFELTGEDGPDPIEGTIPTDPDGDGLYEDFDADGRVAFPDVNRFFQNSDTAAVQNHVEAYDFTGDGTINLQDVMALFRTV